MAKGIGRAAELPRQPKKSCFQPSTHKCKLPLHKVRSNFLQKLRGYASELSRSQRTRFSAQLKKLEVPMEIKIQAPTAATMGTLGNAGAPSMAGSASESGVGISTSQ